MLGPSGGLGCRRGRADRTLFDLKGCVGKQRNKAISGNMKAVSRSHLEHVH